MSELHSVAARHHPSTALAVRQPLNIDDIQRVAKAYAMSGYWPDARDVAQAFVKVSFGAEVGLPAYVAMSEVHIIQGKPTLGAGALAGLVKAHPDYDYRVVEHDLEVCAIEFFDGAGESLGVSRFTVEDAKTANLLSNPTWSKYRRNMLFARAMSNGVAWFAPDVTMGRVYTPDEMGAVVDAEFVEDSGLEPSGAEQEPVADAQSTVSPVAASASSPEHDPTEPADLALAGLADRLEATLLEHSTALDVDLGLVREAVAGKRNEHAADPELLVGWLEQQVNRAEVALAARAEQKFESPIASAKQQTLMVTAASKAGLDDDARHELVERVTGQPSTKAVGRHQVQAVLDAIAEVQS